jgi:hypothetical protein
MEVVMPSDEALALLMLETSWKSGKEEAHLDPGVKLPSSRKDKALWASNAMSSGKFRGWGTDGGPRYNALYMAAREDWKEYHAFDKE